MDGREFDSIAMREIRKQCNLTQKDLALITQMSLSAIQGYEQGRFEPKIEAVERICKALEIPVSALYRGSGLYGSTIERELIEDTESPIPTSEAERLASAVIEFLKLNETGQAFAIDQLKMVSRIPDYRKTE